MYAATTNAWRPQVYHHHVVSKSKSHFNFCNSFPDSIDFLSETTTPPVAYMQYPMQRYDMSIYITQFLRHDGAQRREVVSPRKCRTKQETMSTTRDMLHSYNANIHAMYNVFAVEHPMLTCERLRRRGWASPRICLLECPHPFCARRTLGILRQSTTTRQAHGQHILSWPCFLLVVPGLGQLVYRERAGADIAVLATASAVRIAAR